MMKHYAKLLWTIASLTLVLDSSDQISAAFLDGSAGGSSASGAAASLTLSASGSSSSNSAATAQSATQSSAQATSTNDLNKQLTPATQAIPASSVSSTSSSSLINNQSSPPVSGSSVAANANAVGGSSGAVSQPGMLTSSADKLARLEEFKRSPYYLPPFEDGLISIPEAQLQYEQVEFPKEIELFKQIAREGVERRGKFGSSVALVMKYGGKLISDLIRIRKDEKNLPGSVEPKGEFFGLIADLVQQGIDKSTIIKKERPYTKQNVDPVSYSVRIENLFNYFAKTLARSPFGVYLRWSQLQMYKDDPTNPRYGVNVVDEGADLFAQWRAMGYESSTFLGRRIVNLLRLFARSKVPSVNEV